MIYCLLILNWLDSFETILVFIWLDDHLSFQLFKIKYYVLKRLSGRVLTCMSKLISTVHYIRYWFGSICKHIGRLECYQNLNIYSLDEHSKYMTKFVKYKVKKIIHLKLKQILDYNNTITKVTFNLLFFFSYNQMSNFVNVFLKSPYYVIRWFWLLKLKKPTTVGYKRK